MKTDEELKNLQKLLRQLRCLWSFGTWQDAQVPKIWSEQLKTLPEELRVLKPEELMQLEELGQPEEFALMAQRSLAVRALLRKLVFEQASWA